MGTTRVFQDMLNQYLPNALLKEEMVKRDYFLKNCEHDNSWLGGDYIVPFRAAQASSVKYAALTDAADIAQSQFVRGKISSQPEAWGSMVFNSRDIMEHGKISEQNFLKVLPDEIENHLEFFKNVVSTSFTNGPKVVSFTADTDLDNGIATVDRPERLVIGQKLMIKDANSVAADVYVTKIDMASGAVTLSASRGGAAMDIQAYTTAQGAALYVDGAFAVGGAALLGVHFTSLRDILLTAAQGGKDTIYDQTKANYPYLQPISKSGAAITETNILEKLFDHQALMRNRAAGMANKIVLSYKHWASIMKQLQMEKGAFRQASEVKANQYGWDEVQISSVTGKMDVVAIQEMDDDFISFLDLSSFKVASNGFFKKHSNPDGDEFFTERAATGFKYIVDTCFFGDLICHRPSRNGALYGVSY